MSSKSDQSNTRRVIIYFVWGAVSAILYLQEDRRRGYGTLCILYIMYITTAEGWQSRIMNGNSEDESCHNTAHLQTVVNIILFQAM